MFLFKQEHVEPILNGTKTQTRRLHKRRRAVPGKSHWAQRGMKADTRFARLKITRAWQEKLGAISPDDAIAEGYEDVGDYLGAFFKINKIDIAGKDAVLNALDTVVWCYEFERIRRLP